MLPFIAAIISGLCFAFALPPHNIEWLMWVGIAPLMVASVGRRPLEAVGLGVVASVTAALAQVGIAHSRHFSFLAYYPFILSALVFTVAAVAAAASRRRSNGLAWCLFMACFGVTCEWLTVFLPMPINMAIAEYRQLAVIQIASVTGIWGVSFLIWLTNAVIADSVLVRREEPSPFARRRLMVRPLAALAGVWTVVLGFGVLSLHRHVTAQTIRVAAIQDCTGDETGDLVGDSPAVNADSKGALAANATVDRGEMTTAAHEGGADLAVWSEECLGSSFQPMSKRDETTALARKLGMYLVVGYQNDAPHGKTFNCAGLLDATGKLVGVHHKIFLFAEEVHTIEPGKTATAFPSRYGPLGLEICFDTCNTRITRQVMSRGARLILVPNYDPPTVHGILHNLHAALVTYRAVENHVPLVRSDSNGDSQVIDPDGRVLVQGPLYAPAIVMADVPLGDGRGTLFTRFGDWFAYACIVAAIALGVRMRTYPTAKAAPFPEREG